MTDEEKERIMDMPALCHYPNRSRKFDFTKSEIIVWIQTTFGVDLPVAIRYFERARRNKWIAFDPTSRDWMGCRLMAPREEGNAS